MEDECVGQKHRAASGLLLSGGCKERGDSIFYVLLIILLVVSADGPIKESCLYLEKYRKWIIILYENKNVIALYTSSKEQHTSTVGSEHKRAIPDICPSSLGVSDMVFPRFASRIVP